MSLKIVGIIIARIDSSRLPGKALIKIAEHTLIEYVIKRAKKISGISSLIIATSNRVVDDVFIDVAKKMNIEIFRGAFEDVSHRVLTCAKNFDAEYFIRINADSPFLDVNLVNGALIYCTEGYDLISNIVERTFPYGISCEIINTGIYEKNYPFFDKPEYREHVTKYFYDNIERFKVMRLYSEYEQCIESRLVVDNKSDLLNFKKMLAYNEKVVLEGSYVEVAELYKKLKGEFVYDNNI